MAKSSRKGVDSKSKLKTLRKDHATLQSDYDSMFYEYFKNLEKLDEYRRKISNYEELFEKIKTMTYNLPNGILQSPAGEIISNVKTEMKKHFPEDSNITKLICTSCDYECQDPNNLLQHFQKSHSISNNDIYINE